MSENLPNGVSAGCGSNEQPPWRSRGRPRGAVRAVGTTERPVPEIASLSNIIEVANGNTGDWIVRRLHWIRRARQLSAQYPRQAQHNADRLNREFPAQEPTTAAEVTAVVGLVIMGEGLPVFSLHIENNMANIRLVPTSEEEIPYEFAEILFGYSAPLAEDDARDLHSRLQASYGDSVSWNVALSYLTLLHRMAVPDEYDSSSSTCSEFAGD